MLLLKDLFEPERIKYKYTIIWLQYQKNVYIDNLGDKVNKCNNSYHSTIKMKPVNVNSSTYIDFDKESNKEDPKTEVGHHVRILKYQNIFGKGCTPIWSEEVFVMNKVENTVPWKYIISYPNGEEIVGTL